MMHGNQSACTSCLLALSASRVLWKVSDTQYGRPVMLLLLLLLLLYSACG